MNISLESTAVLSEDIYSFLLALSKKKPQNMYVYAHVTCLLNEYNLYSEHVSSAYYRISSNSFRPRSLAALE